MLTKDPNEYVQERRGEREKVKMEEENMR